ncbi:MAG: hypothetical protein R2761_23590 [Acidimicrobiales bacterium]
MALAHGKNTIVTVDGDDLSAFIKSSDFKRMADSHDVTTYGDNAKNYGAGLTDATFSMEGVYDTTSGGPRGVIEPLIGGAAVTVVRKPEGTGTGKAQDSFSAIVTSYVETNPVGDYVTWSAEFQVSGDIDSTPQS